MIRKTSKGYMVVSKKDHRNLGVYSSTKKAEKRIKQVEYFKKLNKLGVKNG